MSDKEDRTAIRLLRGALAGAVAGAVASFAMDVFQTAASAMSSNDDEGEPATEKAADAISTVLTGSAVSKSDKPLAGQAIHYALGIGLGAAYGIAAEFRPGATASYGTGFGLVTATLLDEGAVPTAGLGSAPWKSGLATHVYSYASHLVFGGTTEIVRRRVAASLTA